MYEYVRFYSSIHLAPVLRQLALGEIRIPSSTEAQPAGAYGYPPALIPFWSDGSLPSYCGAWKHWWVDRSLSFVEMHVEAGRSVREIARNPDQLLRSLIIWLICANDEVTEDVRSFASAVGVEDLDALDALSLETGDDPAGFLALPEFAEDPPAVCHPDLSSYRGEFPLETSILSSLRLDRMCPFEFPPELLPAIAEGAKAPAWFLPGDRRLLFRRFLSEGDLGAAWLTLNSKGWLFADAKIAIAELARRASDPAFSLLAEAWSAVTPDRSGGY